MFDRDPYRQRLQRYIQDMAVSSLRRQARLRLSARTIDEKIAHEIVALAVSIALEKYDTENRTVIAQAHSFERMTNERRSQLHHLMQTAGLSNNNLETGGGE
jgi:hypothetical protein